MGDLTIPQELRAAAARLRETAAHWDPYWWLMPPEVAEPLASLLESAAQRIEKARHTHQAALVDQHALAVARALYATPAPAEAAPIYLVWSNEHRCWWGPDRAGYAWDVWLAGRYDRESAAAVCRTRSWPQDAPPPEVMVLAPEHDRSSFTPNNIRAVPELMQTRIAEATRKAIAERQTAGAR